MTTRVHFKTLAGHHYYLPYSPKTTLGEYANMLALDTGHPMRIVMPGYNCQPDPDRGFDQFDTPLEHHPFVYALSAKQHPG